MWIILLPDYCKNIGDGWDVIQSFLKEKSLVGL